jgi:hypothetical protein
VSPSFLFEWREFGGPNVGPRRNVDWAPTCWNRSCPGAATELLYEPAGFVYRLRVSQAAVADEIKDCRDRPTG